MKKLVLLVVLTVALLGLLAAPATAAKPVAGNYPPSNTPIMIPAFGDGVWAFGTSSNVSNISVYQASDPGVEGYAPIPAGVEVIGTVGVLGTNYGLMNDVPKKIPTSFEITGPDGFHQYFGPKAAAVYWTGPHPWDDWWSEWLGGPPPELFNPKSNAGLYFNHLYLPIGPFPEAGTYHLSFTMVQLTPFMELTYYGEGPLKPIHYKPPALEYSIDFDFNVE